MSNLELHSKLEIKNLKNWCTANRLQINPQKSAATVIPPKLNCPSATINLSYGSALITCQNSHKYLGVTLDNKLNFKSHFEKFTCKISTSSEVISKLRYIFPTFSLVHLYYAIIHPHQLFGLPVWGSTFSSYLAKLQILQNKAIRIITNSNIRASISPQLNKLGILKLSDLYTFETAKIMHQHLNNALPLSLSSLFNKISTIHSRQTRSNVKNNLYIPKFSTNRCPKLFRYQGTKIWNCIPADIKKQSFAKF